MDSAKIKILQSPKRGTIAILSRADGRPSCIGTAICEALQNIVEYPISTTSSRREFPQYRFVMEGELPVVLMHRLMLEWDNEDPRTSFNPALGNFAMLGGEAADRVGADVLYTIEMREADVEGIDSGKGHKGPGRVISPRRPWVTISWSGGQVEYEGWPEGWLANPASKE